MSDFTGDFWSYYVGAITMVGIVACLLLLLITARSRGPASADNTTGHVWDEDLVEMNNPLPTDSFRKIVGRLLERGVSADTIRSMVARNPAELLGAE